MGPPWHSVEDALCRLKLGDDETRISIREGKTATSTRSVFVPGWVADSLREWVDEWGLEGSDRMYWVPRRTLQKEHSRACKVAGIAKYTVHDHRHTFAVGHARAGMPIPLLQRQLGHKRIETTMKYAVFHPDYGDVRKYFRRVEDQLGVGPGTNSGPTPETRVGQTAEENSVSA